MTNQNETQAMAEFIVTARKWRPLKFEDVVGQSHVTVTLRNAIAGNRLAHAYLFSGPRGVGKTTTARLLAKVVNCRHPIEGNPDNECDICQEITGGRSFDTLEIDGASNRGVDEIRSLREAVRYPPAKGAFKTYIIDEVHMLTKEAFNALLKTLEEPPRHVLFIFATTEVHKVPATILSRCQRFEFRRLTSAEISNNLRTIADAEGIHIDNDSLALLARKADGSLRDAQSLFDQSVSLCGRNISHKQLMEELRIVDQEIFFRLTDMIRQKDGKALIELVEEIVQRGYDLKEFLWGLQEHLRNFLVVKTTGSAGLVDAAEVSRVRYQHDAAGYSVADLLRQIRFVAGTEESLKWSSQPRFRIEADLLQLATMDNAQSVGILLEEIEKLKKKTPEGSRPDTPSGAAVGNERQTLPEYPPPALEKKPEMLATVAEPSADERDIQNRWGDFLIEVKKKRISLGTSLDATRVIGVRGDAIRVGCPDEFALTSIKRNRSTLQELLQNFLHTRLHLEPELDQQFRSSAQPVSQVGSVPGTPAGEHQHPVLQALIRELGAEPM